MPLVNFLSLGESGEGEEVAESFCEATRARGGGETIYDAEECRKNARKRLMSKEFLVSIQRPHGGLRDFNNVALQVLKERDFPADCVGEDEAGNRAASKTKLAPPLGPSEQKKGRKSGR